MDFVVDQLRKQAILQVAIFLVWLASVAAKKASYIDAFWGLGFLLLSLLSVRYGSIDAVGSLLLVLTLLWSVRLSAYVIWRNWDEPEDRRYAEMREHRGSTFWWQSYFTIYLLQSVLMTILSAPLQAGIQYSFQSTLGPLAYFGAAVWVVGFAFEAIGDLQMARFKSDPVNHGQVMDRGLWRYTRHPNYFGEACIWWGFYLIAASSGAWWTIFSPILMTFLLLKVSGVSLLEKSIGDRRPDYAAYKRRTSSFFPWPPKNAG